MSTGDESVPVRRTHSDEVKPRPLTIATDIPVQNTPPPVNGSLKNVCQI